MKTLLDCLFVALGGAIGSVSRFLLGKLPCLRRRNACKIRLSGYTKAI